MHEDAYNELANFCTDKLERNSIENYGFKKRNFKPEAKWAKRKQCSPLLTKERFYLKTFAGRAETAMRENTAKWTTFVLLNSRSYELS